MSILDPLAFDSGCHLGVQTESQSMLVCFLTGSHVRACQVMKDGWMYICNVRVCVWGGGGEEIWMYPQLLHCPVSVISR